MNFSLDPFWQAELAVQIHIVCGLISIFLGGLVLFRRKGTRWHVGSGRVWFFAMAGLAVSGLFIHQVRTWGLFSPLHLFSLITIASLGFALYAIRKRNIVAHERTLKGLYYGGAIFAGALTFSQGLTMHRIFFGENGMAILPSPANLPGGIIGFAFGGAALVFLLVMFSGKLKTSKT